MRDKIRMVGLDLDGTLLNGEKKLTSYTRKILDRAIAKGTEIVIVDVYKRQDQQRVHRQQKNCWREPAEDLM